VEKETVTIDIPKDLYDEISLICSKRKTQNNRATADPLYFSVEQDKYVLASKGDEQK